MNRWRTTVGLAAVLPVLLWTAGGLEAHAAQNSTTPTQTADSGYEELGTLIRAFATGTEHGGVFTAGPATASPEPLSPWGGSSLLPPETLQPWVVDSTFQLLVNTATDPVEAAAPVDVKIVRGTTLVGGGQAAYLPPFDPTTAVADLAGILDASGATGSGDLLVIPPTGDSPAFTGGPVLVRGGHFAGDVPPMCSSDAIIELGFADAVSGAPPWKPAPAFPNDLFTGASQATVTRCEQGRWQPAELLVNTGSGFASTPTGTLTVIGPAGFVQLQPASEVGPVEGTRTFSFLTTTANPYQADTTGFFALPAFPGLAPPTGQALMGDPFAGFATPPDIASDGFALPLELSSGTCSPQTATHDAVLYGGITNGGDTGTFTPLPLATGEAWSLLPDVNSYTFVLLQHDTLQASRATVAFDPQKAVLEGLPSYDSLLSGEYAADRFVMDLTSQIGETPATPIELTGPGAGSIATYTLDLAGGTGTYAYESDTGPCTWDVRFPPAKDLQAKLTAYSYGPLVLDLAGSGAAPDDASGPAGSSPTGPTPLWPWIFLGTGVVALGGGALLRRRGPRPAAAGATAPVATPPPATDPNADGFIYEALAGLGGAPTTVSPADSDHAWEVARGPELRAQRRIASTQAHILAGWSSWYGRFKAAALRFAGSYVRAWQGSDGLRTLQSDWQVRVIAARAIDLAAGLIMLVRGAFQLGRGVTGWWRARTAARLAARSAEEVLAMRRAAEVALEASPELTRFADGFMGAGRAGLKMYRDELVEAIMWGQEAGVDAVAIMTQRLEEVGDLPIAAAKKLDAVREAVIGPAAAALGLVEATPAVADAVDGCAGVLGTLAHEGATLTDESAGAVRAFVQVVDETPGFWDKAGDMFVRLGRGSDDTGQFTGEIANLVNGNSIDSLRALYDAAKAAGDDLTRLPQLFRDALGPARATALASGATPAVIPSTLMASGGGTVAGTSGGTGGPAQVGSVGSVDAQMQQYGITGESFGGNVWDLLTSPVETTSGMWHSWFALDELEDLMSDHADDMNEMSQAWSQAVNALHGLATMASGGKDGLDPIDDLTDAVRDLDRAQSGLRDVWRHASPEWQRTNRHRYDDTMAHIDRKKAAIERLIGGLRRLRAAAGRMTDRLERMARTPDGHQRSALEWIDPDLSAALSQVTFQLESIGFDMLSTGG